MIIAGAGPSGLMLAGELALAGVRALVLEKRPVTSAVERASGVGGQTLNLLRYRGLLDRFQAGQHPSRTCGAVPVRQPAHRPHRPAGQPDARDADPAAGARAAARRACRRAGRRCYVKSHLLAAILRAEGIPAGLCYQRLGDETDSFVLHGLVAVYLDGGWHRQDPRGNKAGIEAQFSLGEERLAYRVAPERGEIDYPEVRVTPSVAVLTALRSSADALSLCESGLPADLTSEAECTLTMSTAVAPARECHYHGEKHPR